MLRERRPSRTQLAANFGLLAAELQRCFGGGPLPSAVELRAMKREDLAQVNFEEKKPCQTLCSLP